jgi:hypothetical protein
LPKLDAHPTPKRIEARPPSSIAHIEVREGTAPGDWDERVRALGGGPFHCASWARYRTSAEHKRALFFTWSASDSPEPAAVALGIETALPGPLRARSIHFDSPPATSMGAPTLRAHLELWMRSQAGVADAWLGSFDAKQAWTDGATSPTRIEFRVAPAPPDELLAGMRVMARRSIRKTERSGIAIDTDSPQLSAFAALYGETLDRLRRAKGVSTLMTDHDGYAERLAVLRQAGTARLFLASASGEPVAGALFTAFGRRAFYISGGTSELGRKAGAMTAVLYRAMCEFSAAGFECINLGGVSPDGQLPSSPDHGLHEFKRGLGGVAHPCCDATIVVRPMRRRLVDGARTTRGALLRVRSAARRREPR